jgi:ferredoxin
MDGSIRHEKEPPWRPSIDEEACLGCGVCVDVCPRGVYALNADKAEVAQPGSVADKFVRGTLTPVLVYRPVTNG